LIGNEEINTNTILLFSLNSFSQTYFPFPDSVGVWRIRSENYDGNLTYYSFFDYFLNGDTTINSTLYSKMYLSTGTQIIDTLNSGYYGALREFNKKIYFYPDSNMQTGNPQDFCYNWNGNSPNYSEDLLLYDFNVGVGDTVHYFHLDSSYIIINSIDSILIQGQYRKRYNHSGLNGISSCGWFSSYSYVEGIGNITEGLFHMLRYYFEHGYYLRCFEDENILYSNVGDCSTFGGVRIEEQLDENNLTIYPNPSSSNLTIELIDINTSFKAQVYINDITGKEVYSTSISSTINNIDVSSFKSGLYLLKIVSNNGEVKSSLVSIQ
jgi:hypothetical protein